MRRYILLAVFVGALGFVGNAAAKVVTVQDDAGRDIVFNVRTGGVNVEWYADLLRKATHGREISAVTFRIVRRDVLPRFCGSGAAGCYQSRRAGAEIVIPAGQNADVAHTLLHEYGHHIDHARKHRALPEPNGSAAWWAARKMGIRLNRGKVAFGYQLGWSRSVGEIFAEDYAQTQLQTEYDIPWLSPPDRVVRDALERDLGALPAQPVRPDSDPLIIRRSGAINPGRRLTLPFELLGPDRRVIYTVTMQGKKQIGARARLQLTCGDVRLTRELRRGSATVRIDRGGLGPSLCQVSLTNTAGKSLFFNVKLRLVVQA